MTNIDNPVLKRQLSRWYKLKPHPTQIELKNAIKNGVRFPIVPAGRRCLAKGTLVATPNGGVPIEQLKVGDEVIGFDGLGEHPTRVVSTYSFGVQPVVILNDEYRSIAATPDHKLWASIDGRHFQRTKVSDLTPDHVIKTAAGATKLHKVCDATSEVYDITVSNATNLYFLHNGIVTSNSGKTERFKRFVATEAMTHYNGKYFMGAPTNAQAKKIFWDDMLELTLSCLHTRKPNLTDRIIYLPTGSEIHVIGLENAKRIEGIQWTGGGIDEVADVKGEYFGANIFPALDTVDPRNPTYRAWCWLLGVPDGLNHYYDMAQDALSGKTPDAKVFHWKSSEILPPDLIEAAKRRMSRKQYLQEYEASFETAGGKIYEDYSTANHTTATIQDTEVLHWSHDQNYTPLSSCIAVIRKGVPYFLDEIVLESAVSRQSALEFLEKFKNHKNKKVYIYGDPAGRAGEKHGHQSDYTAIEDVLRGAGWAFERRVRRAHPAIKDRQNAVRTKVCSASGIVSLYVNPVTAPWCHKALATCQLKHGSSFQEDETNQYQHISTAIGYFVERMWPLQGIVTTSFNTTGY